MNNMDRVPLLRGEAPADKFGFKTQNGEPSHPGRVIFPIIKSDPSSRLDVLGTGFFIAQNIFVTARHVLEAPFDRRTGRQIFPIWIIHFCEEGTYIIRPILRCAWHPVADLAVGVAAPMSRDSDGAPLENKTLVISEAPVDLDADVMTYAYPRYQSLLREGGQILNLMPAHYDGRIIEHLPNGRDRVLLPGPCYRTSIAIHHGASGGPVFSKGGMAFAINSTGFDGTDDSYISSIGGIFDLAIDDVSIAGQLAGRVTVRELVRLGYVAVG